MAKDDYSGARDARKKCRNLFSLRQSGDLDSEGETMAERWRNDYEFAQFGYADFMREPTGADYIKGDAITFAVSRGLAGERVALVREILGTPAHGLLVRLLHHDHSFASIARDLLSNADTTAANKAVRQRAVQLLQILPGAYKTARKMQKDGKVIVRK
ncbi:hypothetical protein ABHV46_10875 [Asaia sp. BMEF1]|uniref:hypothetical protein n=1 Tax=Asaia sp. BMEF1 TaxID=3155932 RepID=UPI003F66A269